MSKVIGKCAYMFNENGELRACGECLLFSRCNGHPTSRTTIIDKDSEVCKSFTYHVDINGKPDATPKPSNCDSKEAITYIFIDGSPFIEVHYEKNANVITFKNGDIYLAACPIVQPIRLSLKNTLGGIADETNVLFIFESVIDKIKASDKPVNLQQIKEWCAEGNIAATARAKGEIPEWPEPPKEALGTMGRMIKSACLSYRHDFGLMDMEAQIKLEHEATEWYHVWRKEFETMKPSDRIGRSA